MKSLCEMVEVMQAALDGMEIEQKQDGESEWTITKSPWNWGYFDYRIKPTSPIFLSLTKMDDGLFHCNMTFSGEGKGDTMTMVEVTPGIRAKLGL